MFYELIDSFDSIKKTYQILNINEFKYTFTF